MKRHELHKMKQLPYQVLLDYVDKVLSEEETTILNEYFDENPDDILVAEGAKLFYEIEKTERDELERYLNTEAADVDFLFKKIEEENISGKQSQKNKFGIRNRRIHLIQTLSLVASVACLILATIINWPDFKNTALLNDKDLSSSESVAITYDPEKITTTVWPGDRNPDGIVNMIDFLNLSKNHGQIDPIRPDSSIVWLPQPSPDWGYKPDLSQLRFGDFNGDGNTDVFAIRGEENTERAHYIYANVSQAEAWHESEENNNLHSVPITVTTEGYSGSPIFKGKGNLGLYDMMGDVWEWCSDSSQQDSYHSLKGSIVYGSGRNRVIRGGSWNHKPYYLSTGNLFSETDQLIKRWSIDHDREFNGNGPRVSNVIFSPHGKRILTGSWDNTVRLWDLKGENIQQSEGHSNSISSVAFSLDDQHILVGSEDNTVRLWLLPSISNYGLTSVDIIAPGDGIYSTLPDKDYGHLSGTSMAAPYMSRVAAILYSQDSSIKNERQYNQEFYNFQLHSDMVVLSACETGIGEFQRGEGIISLAKSFSSTGSLSLNAVDLYLDLGSYRDSSLISWVPTTQYTSDNVSWTDAIYMSMEQTDCYFSPNPGFEFIDNQRAHAEGSISKRSSINIDSAGQWAVWFIEYGLKASKQQAVNMCAYEGGNLKFWVKAEPGVKDLIVGIRSKDVLPYNERSKVLLSNYSQFEADDQWHEVTIPLQFFLGVDYSQISVLYMMSPRTEAGAANRDATFWINDVRWLNPYIDHLTQDTIK